MTPLPTKAAEIRAGLGGADELDATETMSPQDTARDLVDRFRSGDCPFCGHDPYHYVDNGVGMERVAVTCCDLGIALFQDGDEQLSRASGERHEAANALSDLLDLIEQQAAELAREQTKSARRLACMDRRADRLIELTDALAKVKTEHDGLLSTWAESRERHLAAEARATTAESELAAECQRSDTLRVQRDGHAAELAEARTSEASLTKRRDYYRERMAAAGAELNAISAAIGSARFLDPPDGGDVSLAEQVKRMRQALTTAESERAELLREKERLVKLSDRYGVALMMIRAGCSQPQRFAGNILDDKKPVEIDLEDCDEDHR